MLLTNLLTVVILASAHAYQPSVYYQKRSPASVTEAEIELFKKWATSHGRLLNPVNSQPSERVQKTETEIANLLKTRIQRHPDFNKYHWKILIYHSENNNAFAYMATPEMGEEKDWNNSHHSDSWPIRRAMNISDDKPIAFIGITTKMLETLQTKGQLAYVLGHEAKHIFDRHGVTGAGLQAHAARWMDTQGKEVIADLGSVDFMVGHDPLDSALDVLDMFSDDAKTHESNKLHKHLEQAAVATAQTHHHPSVRQSIVQSRVVFLNRFDKRAPVKPSDPIPILWKSISEKPIESPLKGERLVVRYRKLIEFVKNQPEFIPLVSYADAHNEILERDTVEGLRESKMVINSFLDILSSSELSAHKKAMLAATFLIRQMELPGWQTYFASASPQEILRWKRLLVGLSPESLTQNVFSHDREYLDYRHELFSLFERGVLANGFSDDLVKRNPTWLEIIRRYMIPRALELLVKEGKSPAFQFIAATLGTDQQEVLSRRVTKLSHQGKIHRELVLQTVQMLESFPIDRFLRIKEEKYNDESKQLKLLLQTHRAIQTVENKEALKNAGLDKTVERLWTRHRPLIQHEIFENIRRLISQPNFDGYIEYTDNISSSLGLLISLDSTLIEGAEFRDLIVKLINKLMLGSPNEVLLAGRLGILQHLDEKTKNKLVYRILSDATLPPEVRFRSVFGLHWGNGEPFDKIVKSNPQIRAYLRLVLQKMRVDTVAGQTEILVGAPWNKHFKSTIPANGPIDRGEYTMLLGLQNHQLSVFQTILATGIIPRLTDELAEILIKEMTWNLDTITRTGIDYWNSEYRSPMSGADILVDWIVAKGPRLTEQREFLDWFAKYEKILKIVSRNFLLSSSQKQLAGDTIVRGLNLVSKLHLQKALKRSSVRLALSDQQFADLIIDYLTFAAPPGKGKDFFRSELTRIEKELNFNELNSDIKNRVYNKMAELHNVQPGELNTIFPVDPRTETEKYDGKHGLVRVLSGVVSFLEKRSPTEQLQTIDYLMGRTSTEPAFIREIQMEINKVHTRTDLNRYLTMARSRLSSASVMERTIAINNVLGGKESFFNSPGGNDAVLNYLVKSLPTEQSTIVKDFGGAVMRAEGRHASLFASYILAQKDPSAKSSAMSVELLIKGILDFYGVPGWKLAQYLGFSGEFKQFQSALAQYQDAAFPPDYLEILIYLRDHYSDKFDFSKVKILKILGTGSVNIAIEYLDLVDNKNKVFNVPRQNIKNQTRQDFQRFRKFIAEVLKVPNARQYEFLEGLMGTIEKSVNLEFDRKSVLQRQRDAIAIYNGQSKGWKVRTVDTYGSIDDIILLEKAYGLGATKIVQSDPQLYKSALHAVFDFEFKHLQGRLQKSNDDFVNIANPDLHDGQVFIDKETKTVTIIDFGQAVPIDANQRSLGIDVLSFLGDIVSAEVYVQKINAQKSTMGWSQSLSASDLASVIERKEPMDRFVQLIAVHSKKGLELPLPTVHWILGMNRLRTLGNKIGIHPDISIAKMVYGKIIKEKVTDVISKAKQLFSSKTTSANKCQEYYKGIQAN